jgi:hypothetical protein
MDSRSIVSPFRIIESFLLGSAQGRAYATRKTAKKINRPIEAAPDIIGL